LRQERMRLTSFNDSAQRYREEVGKFRRVRFEVGLPQGSVALRRRVARFPYVPYDVGQWDAR